MARSCEIIPVDRTRKRARDIIRAPESIRYQQTFRKPGMLLPVPKIDPIPGRPHKTLPIFTTFTNMNRPTALTTDVQKYMSILLTTSLMPRNPLGSRIRILISYYYLLGQHWQVTTKCHSWKFCLLYPSIILRTGTVSCQTGPSFFLFFSQPPACMFLSYSLSFSLPHNDSKLHIAVIVIFQRLGLNRFF